MMCNNTDVNDSSISKIELVPYIAKNSSRLSQQPNTTEALLVKYVVAVVWGAACFTVINKVVLFILICLGCLTNQVTTLKMTIKDKGA